MDFGMGKNIRVYWHDKKPVPSVSTIMKMFNNGIPFNWPAWRAMEYVKSSMMDPLFSLEDILTEAVDDAKRYMNSAATLGTAVHATIERYFKTGVRDPMPIEDPEFDDWFTYEKMCTNVFKWIDKHNVTPILVEKAMSNEVYAGTLDLYCELDSEAFETKRWCRARGLEFPLPHRRVETLLDWKVCKGYYEDMPVKLSAYYALLGEYGYKPEKMLIVRFSKETGSVNIKDYTDELDDSFITFELACKLFHHNFHKFLKETEQEAERQRIAKVERKKKIRPTNKVSDWMP